ncbi:MAG: hypothetical protein JNM88_11580 [Chitinophagaceae bacterium]|nr:hypothetical protein [Chitinophagaceae bacterium]
MKYILFLLSLTLSGVLPAQNVGIGTTTPAVKLHVLDPLNDVHLRVESVPAGSEAGIRLLAGNNPFSFLQFSKYAAGATGTYAGLPKDNLSVIATGGNAGALVLSTGDGVSPVVFAAGTGERMRVLSNGQVSIGTSTPNAYGKLLVHDEIASQDVSISLTNSLTGPANFRGARFRFLNSDLNIMNYEATGKIHLSTSFNTRLTVDAIGNVGIGEAAPAHKLDIANSDNTRGINISHTGNNTDGVYVQMGNSPNNRGMYIANAYNYSPGNFSLGIHAVSGSGAAVFYTPTINYGVVGECQNTAVGGGVLGISNAPSPGVITGGVLGTNFSAAANAYGVVGSTSSVDGAGVAGRTSNGSAGVLAYAINATGPALKALCVGTSSTAIDLNNGAMKVSGANRTVFQHEATAGNTASNETVIPNSTLANSATDLLIVTPYWDGVYLNATIGVYFSGGTWRIFRQDLGAMPVGAKFNVLVVKQ